MYIPPRLKDDYLGHVLYAKVMKICREPFYAYFLLRVKSATRIAQKPFSCQEISFAVTQKSQCFYSMFTPCSKAEKTITELGS